MTTLERLRHWNETGIIADVQYRTLGALVRQERFSVFLELNAFLYIGVLSFVAGLGWTFQTYFTNLGDPFILTTFSLLFAGCLAYCFSRASPFTHAEVESPNLAFDYVLYLGCLILSAGLAYIEFRFHLFPSAWDHYLLFTTATFALLAYRFDNRFVLSLALASLAGWFGLKMSALGLRSTDALTISALVYGVIIAGTGAALHRKRIKPHFLETYLHVAANVVLAAIASRLFNRTGDAPYLAALIALSAIAIVLGVRWSRFVFVAYGIVYGYAGISFEVLQRVSNGTAFFGYFVVTGTLVIIALVILARRFGRDE
jgi:hypothetical protein